MTDPVRTVRDALHAKGCNPDGELLSFTALCPAHDDTRPSLIVSEGSDRRALIHCYACCTTADVVAALGLRMADLFPAGHRKGHQPRPVVRRAKSPAEKLIEALDACGFEWSGVLVSRCPFCDHPSATWQVGPGATDARRWLAAWCPDGCRHDNMLRALECRFEVVAA